MQTLIIIPAYNEAFFLKKLLPDLKKINADILVIDDGSKDETSQVAKDFNVNVIRNSSNYGKGYSLKRGFQYAIENKYEQVVTMDADGQHLPQDVNALIEKTKKSNADIIIGNRMTALENMPLIRKFTNYIMSKIISFFIKLRIPDTQCGLKLIKRKVLEGIELKSKKFEIESEILIEAVRKGFRIESHEISTIYSKERISNIRPFLDTLRFLKYILNVANPIKKIRWYKKQE